MHGNSGGGTTVDLLKKIVLLLTHHLVSCSLLLPSFQLVLQTLSVDPHARVTNNLLSRVSCNPTAAPGRQLTHTLQAGVKRQ